jgi:peptidoglycan hydrolase-like protein with peptidoglycan-binding domain
MRMNRLLLSMLLALLSLPAVGQDPQAAAGETVSQPQAQGPYADPLVMRVQEQLNTLGFDAGPPNGEWNERTQAALAQFQLSRTIPAGGQLDERTLGELGVVREGT